MKRKTNPFRINTYRSVSKTKHFNPIRIRTYAKPGRGVCLPPPLTHSLRRYVGTSRPTPAFANFRFTLIGVFHARPIRISNPRIGGSAARFPPVPRRLRDPGSQLRRHSLPRPRVPKPLHPNKQKQSPQAPAPKRHRVFTNEDFDNLPHEANVNGGRELSTRSIPAIAIALTRSLAHWERTARRTRQADSPSTQ